MTAAVLKQILARIATARYLRTYMRNTVRKRYGILFYHYAGNKVPYFGFSRPTLSLRDLETDIKCLKQYFEFVSLANILESPNPEHQNKRPKISMTFDDGFDIVSSGALDLLDKYGIPVTFFLITGCIGNKSMMWRHKMSAIISERGEGFFVKNYRTLSTGNRRQLGSLRTQELLDDSLQNLGINEKEEFVDELWEISDMPPIDDYLALHKPYLDETQITDLITNGHTIGLHSQTHPNFKNIKTREILDEVVQPAALLKRRFGLTQVPFSYPFGWRMRPEFEKLLFQEGILSCILGVSGISRKGCPIWRLERADCEKGIGFSVFGKTLLFSILEALGRSEDNAIYENPGSWRKWVYRLSPMPQKSRSHGVLDS
jgi:peptidoglycan/xylan/chitin deacetylase (PgdA/CDA1 family)